MQMKTLHYASTIGLAGILALAHPDAGPRPASPRIEPLSRVTQYCVPPEDDPSAYRLYCRMDMADRQRLTPEQRLQKTVPTIPIATKQLE